jgi:hypothetical protein
MGGAIGGVIGMMGSLSEKDSNDREAIALAWSNADKIRRSKYGLKLDERIENWSAPVSRNSSLTVERSTDKTVIVLRSGKNVEMILQLRKPSDEFNAALDSWP